MTTTLVADCGSEDIIELATELTAAGFGKFAREFYNEGGNDFFKITKPAGEREHAVFIDLESDGCSVHGLYGHEHGMNAKNAVSFAKQIYDGKILNCVFVCPFCSAAAFVDDAEDKEKLVVSFAEYCVASLNQPNSGARAFLQMPGHQHILAEIARNMIEWTGSENEMHEGCKFFIKLSAVGAEREDVYLF